MNRGSIKEKLESKGYYTVESYDDLIVGKYNGEDTELGGILIRTYWTLVFKNGMILIDYDNKSIPEIEEFNSELKAIAFIKEKFPL